MHVKLTIYHVPILYIIKSAHSSDFMLYCSVRNDTQDSTITDSTIGTGKQQCHQQLHPMIADRRTSALSYQNRGSRTSRFLRIFQCIAKKTLDDKKVQSVESPVNSEPQPPYEYRKPDVKEIFNMSPYNVSNSSLRDIENGALEDELTIYMKEIQRREKDSS